MLLVCVCCGVCVCVVRTAGGVSLFYRYERRDCAVVCEAGRGVLSVRASRVVCLHATPRGRLLFSGAAHSVVCGTWCYV